MREILFRGKRLDNGEWVVGSLICWGDGSCLIETGSLLEPPYAIDFDTVGQYTGLTDKNGKMIFEGDICRFREWSRGDMCWIGKVRWEHQMFVIAGGPNRECEVPFYLQMSRFISEDIEIIGNIHDNPELMKGK